MDDTKTGSNIYNDIIDKILVLFPEVRIVTVSCSCAFNGWPFTFAFARNSKERYINVPLEDGRRQTPLKAQPNCEKWCSRILPWKIQSDIKFTRTVGTTQNDAKRSFRDREENEF